MKDGLSALKLKYILCAMASDVCPIIPLRPVQDNIGLTLVLALHLCAAERMYWPLSTVFFPFFSPLLPRLVTLLPELVVLWF